MTTPELRSERLLLEQADWLRALARRLLRDEAFADDAVQDTFVAALRRPPEEGPRRSWLAAVLGNAVRQELRARGRRRAHEAAARERGAEPSAADIVGRVELQRRVADAVLALDEPYRTAIVLRFLDGLPPREVARRTGAPVKTVQTRIERGLAKLRLALDADYGRRETWSLALLPLAAPRLGIAGTLAGVALMSTQVKLAAALAVILVATLATVAWRARGPEGEPVAAFSSAPVAPALASAAAHDARGALEAARATADERRTLSAAVPAERAPAPEPSFIGRVVDDRGAPVGGLRVRYQPLREGARPANTAVESAADGSFRMPLPAVTGVLTAEGRGLSSAVEPGIAPHPPPVPPTIVVGPAAIFGGEVVDDRGEPLPGAELALLLPRERAFELSGTHFTTALRRAEAGSDGRFAFAEVGALPGLLLDASKDGHAPARVELSPATSLALRIVLPRLHVSGEPVVAGRVVDETGAPLEGAYVALDEETARTDAAGGFTLLLPASGDEPVLRVAASGRLPTERTLARRADGRLADEAPVVVVLSQPALSITGRVVDAAGEPVPGAQVWTPDGTFFGFVTREVGGVALACQVDVEEVLGGAAETWSRDPREATSDAEGGFELRGLAARDYALYAMHPRTQEIASLAAVPAGAEGALLRLAGTEASAPVAGRVVTWSGEPVEGALIRVQRQLDRPVRFFRAAARDFYAMTDAEGAFRFDVLPLEGTQLLLNGEMIATPQTLALADVPELESITFRVPERSWIRVTLRDPRFADSIALLDGEGDELTFTVTAGTTTLGAQMMMIEGGRSGLVQTDRSARTLVLYSRGEEVLRTALELRPGEVHEIDL